MAETNHSNGFPGKHWNSDTGEGIDNAGFVDDTKGNSIALHERTSVPTINSNTYTKRPSQFSNGNNNSIPNEKSEETVKEDVEAPDRAQWSNSVEFLLSCIAMSVGIGNFYRFPFVAYQNGGGAFLIPYIIVLFFIGKPMYFLELSVGQFCAFGQVKCWEMSPFFKGVGFGSTLCSFCVVTYYCSVMALTVFYLFASMQANLPWSVCDPSWAGQEACDILANATAANNTRINLPALYFR